MKLLKRISPILFLLILSYNVKGQYASPSAVCAGTPIHLYCGGLLGCGIPTSVITWQGPGGFISNLENPVIYPGDPGYVSGTFYIAIQLQDGTMSSGNANVIVNQLPTIVITASATTVCTGESVTLSGGGGVSYVWNNGISNGVPFIPLSTANYTVTATDVNSCTNTAQILITVNPTPTVVITNPASGCSPLTVNLTAPAVTAGSTAGLTFTYWVDPAATIPYATPSAATAGIYYIKGTDAAGCFDKKPVTVTIYPSPVVVITNPSACSPATVDLTAPAVTAGSTASLTYSYWLDASATTPYNTPATATAGTYYIKGTTAAGCYDVKPVTVTVNPSPTVTITNPAAVCSPATVNLTAASVTAGSTPGLTFTYWVDAAASMPYSTPTTAAAGLYYIKGITAAGCPDIKPVTVTVNPSPTVVINNPAAVCTPATVDLTAAAITAGSTSGLVFTYWTNASATAPYSTPSAATPGTYYIKGITGAGCFDIQPVIVTVNPNGQVNQPANQEVCNNSSSSPVNFTTINTGGITNYSWSNNTPGIGLGGSGNGNILTFTAVNIGTVPVVATITVTPHYTFGAVTCDGPSKLFTITVNPDGQVNQPASQEVCDGSSISQVIFGTSSTGGTTTYSWTNSAPAIGLAGSGTGNISPFISVNNGTAPIIATIVVTPHNTIGSTTCNGPAKAFTITVNPKGQLIQPGSQEVCNNSTTSLVAFNTLNTSGTTTYTWANNTTSIGLGASGSGNILPFTAVNNGTIPVIATITVIPHFTNGSVTCDGPSKIFTITVNPSGQVLSLIHI